jgi:hypothetical protein
VVMCWSAHNAKMDFCWNMRNSVLAGAIGTHQQDGGRGRGGAEALLGAHSLRYGSSEQSSVGSSGG